MINTAQSHRKQSGERCHWAGIFGRPNSSTGTPSCTANIQPFFSANPSHCWLLSLLSGLTPRTVIDTSEHIRFTFQSFFFPVFFIFRFPRSRLSRLMSALLSAGNNNCPYCIIWVSESMTKSIGIKKHSVHFQQRVGRWIEKGQNQIQIFLTYVSH